MYGRTVERDLKGKIHKRWIFTDHFAGEAGVLPRAAVGIRIGGQSSSLCPGQEAQ